MYVAENKAEFMQAAVSSDSKKAASSEDLTKVTRQVKTYGWELVKKNDVKHFLEVSALTFKRNMQRLLKFEKEIQEQVAELDQFMFKRIIPCLEPRKLYSFLNWATAVSFGLKYNRLKNRGLLVQYESIAKMTPVFDILSTSDTEGLIKIEFGLPSETDKK
jgi:hypothetical protein